MLCKYCTNTLCISKCSSRFVFHFQTFCVILSRAIVRATHTHTPTLCCWILDPMVCAYSAVHGIKIFFTRLRVPSDGMIGAAHLRLQTRRIQVAPISINVCVWLKCHGFCLWWQFNIIRGPLWKWENKITGRLWLHNWVALGLCVGVNICYCVG